MLRRTVRAGSSYLSQSEANPILFGLGGRTVADSLVVRWPTSGRAATFGSLEADRLYVVEEASLEHGPDSIHTADERRR